MTAPLSQKLEAFEQAFDILNAELFDGELSRSVITISPTPGAYGHFTPWKSWQGDDDQKFYEINLAAENIDRPIVETMATLVHEMVHQWCHEHKIKDTSRGATYHNKAFKAEAERRGLAISYERRIGWSVTKPGERLIEMEENGFFSDCDKELHRLGSFRDEIRPKSASSTRKYVCPCCGMSVRATKEVYVICGECQETMEVDE
jgi:hypothetical protein